MNENMENNKELIDNLYQFIQNTKNQQLQLKPNDFNYNQDNASIYDQKQNLQEYKQKNRTFIDRELKIISQNIIDSIFGLNNKKYNAIISRMSIWGYELTLQQFIINYYLIIKKDNKLRQFVINHLQKLIKLTKGLMDKELITVMKDFEFSNKNKIAKLQKQKIQNQKKLKEIKLKDIKVKEQKEENKIQDEAEQNNIQQQILQKLKKEHPKLEQEL